MSCFCIRRGAGIGDAGVAFRGAWRAFVTDVARFFPDSDIREALSNILEKDLLFDKRFDDVSLLAKVCFQFRGEAGSVAVALEKSANAAKGVEGGQGVQVAEDC